MKYELPCLDGKPKPGFGNCCKVSIDSMRVFSAPLLRNVLSSWDKVICVRFLDQVHGLVYCIFATTISAQWGRSAKGPGFLFEGADPNELLDFVGKFRIFI